MTVLSDLADLLERAKTQYRTDAHKALDGLKTYGIEATLNDRLEIEVTRDQYTTLKTTRDRTTGYTPPTPLPGIPIVITES